jgi:hypothetical protein
MTGFEFVLWKKTALAREEAWLKNQKLQPVKVCHLFFGISCRQLRRHFKDHATVGFAAFFGRAVEIACAVKDDTGIRVCTI